jgi:ceramide glucosyltransferase
VGLAAGANLLTPLKGETLTGWRDWLTRQMLYLKFCLPGTWLAVGFLFYLLAGLALLAGLWLMAAPLGGSPALAWFGAVFLAGLTGLALILKTMHPKCASWRAWLPGFYAAIFMAAWCHLRTWPLKELNWRGISYRVARKGRVEGINK